MKKYNMVREIMLSNMSTKVIRVELLFKYNIIFYRFLKMILKKSTILYQENNLIKLSKNFQLSKLLTVPIRSFFE